MNQLVGKSTGALRHEGETARPRPHIAPGLPGAMCSGLTERSRRGRPAMIRVRRCAGSRDTPRPFGAWPFLRMTDMPSPAVAMGRCACGGCPTRRRRGPSVEEPAAKRTRS